ncbi:MAG: DegV family protein [Solirubrobacteraceae bacterium]|nr:MAG: DegV family protein [Solirubrobacterales bacterium]
MARVAIVTDTTHYLPRELVHRHGLHEVSLYVHWDGRHEREADLADFDEFYEHLRTSPTLPTTSQPSVGDFLAVYEPLLAEGNDILSIHLAGGISGTVSSAEQAAGELGGRGLGDRIHVFDSRSACGGMGLIALAAAAAAEGGASLPEALQRARTAAEESRIWFAIETLEYLRRGGRIGAAQAWMGSALKIKPILTVDGEISPIERVRTSGRAFERMVEYLESRKEDGATRWALQHIQATERIERIAERGRELFGTEPEFCSEIGPVIGTHVGPGLIGVAGIRPALLGPPE